jgi:ABC-type Fe3+ transport system permease subunit
MAVAVVLAMLMVCLCTAMAMGSQWGGDGVRREVTYDSRALVLNGARSSGGARKCRLGIPPKKKLL